MNTYVISSGSDEIAKREYSYGRRPQSTVRTLRWRQRAIITAPSLAEAVESAKELTAEWVAQGFKAEKWQVEGRGKAIHECYEWSV